MQSNSGKVRKGTITESDEQAARERLESAGFKVMSLAESADLIVHTPNQGTTGRTKPQIQRAAIIDFEETTSEKIVRLLNTYILRREAAMILAVTGLIWIVVGMSGRSKPEGPQGPVYVPHKVVVTVTASDQTPDRVEVRLPDVPFKTSQEWKDASSQDVVLDFEATRQPDRVEVTLYEGDTKVAFEKGHLNSSGAGQYTYSANPLPYKE